MWYAEEEKEDMVPPGAPRIKDLDSFTEGTGCGSFEDLPMTGNADYDYADHVTPMAISRLPPPDTLKVSIEKWKASIADSSVPLKRRRSPSPEGERFVRRIRPRTRAVSLPSNFKAFTDFIGFPTSESEREAPD